MSLIPGLGRYPGEGNGYPLQHSGLENSMDHIVHGVTKSLTWLSDFHFASLHEKRTKLFHRSRCFKCLTIIERSTLSSQAASHIGVKRISFNHCSHLASLMVQILNSLPAMQEMWVWFLGQKDPLEKEMAPHSSILAWRIPRPEEPDWLHSMG